MSLRNASALRALVFGLVLGSVAKSAEPIRVSVGSAPPLEYRDSAGQPQGFTVEVIREAARRQGVQIVWQPGGNMQQNNDALRGGTLDLIVGATDTMERRQSFWVSDPWWWAEAIALVPAASTVRSEADFAGLRLATPAATQPLAANYYPHSTVKSGPNTLWAAEEACTGAADVALVENMYLRELLLGTTGACRPISLRVFDIGLRREYVMVARPGISNVATALRQRIDEITMDGTLAKLAAKHLPVSTPQATRMSELLRARHGQQLLRIRLIAAAAGVLAAVLFLIWSRRSAKHLGALNKRLQTAQHEREAYLSQLETVLDNLSDAVFVADPEGMMVYWNRAAGVTYNLGEIVGRRLSPREFEALLEFAAADGADLAAGQQPLARILRGELLRNIVLRVRRTGQDRERMIECSGSLARDKEGKPLVAVVSTKDVTEIRQAEEEKAKLHAQVLQSQRIESIGRLAGGVAHDFNNLLTVINGYGDLALAQLPAGDPLHQQILEIRKAGGRAAELTTQLLAFSRKQVLLPKVVCLNDIVRDSEKMLRRLIGEDIELSCTLDPTLRPVEADPGRLHQMIMNLVVNARDAMPGGGTLHIDTANCLSDDSCAACSPMVGAAKFVILTVRDTGIGMDAATVSRLFEPFFTTKEFGNGTGLGLAIVHGIVAQSGGHISVSSELHRGSAFTVHLPVVERPAFPEPDATPASRGTETILLVEDQAEVRRFIATILEQHGYRILEAGDAEHALKICEVHGEGIDLLITDVVMPGMKGTELASQLQKLNSRLRVLYISGYLDTAIPEQDVVGSDGTHFLQKPFAPEALAAKVRALLD